MRIAMVTTPFESLPPQGASGVHEVAWWLIKGLNELGHEVIVLGPEGCDVPGELVPICEAVIPLKEMGLYGPEVSQRLSPVRARVHEAVRDLRHRVDIIHTHAVDLPEFRAYPVLRTLHARLLLGELKEFLARQCHWYVTVSADQMKTCYCDRLLGFVYNGEDPSAFPIVEEPDDYLCMVGRICPDKGTAEAIELAIALGIRIKIAGPVFFNEREYFENKIQPHLTHPLVEYLGELSSAERRFLQAHAKVNFHLATWREAFGLSVLEASYCGTPTLALRRGAMAEVIEDGGSGILVEDTAEAFLAFERILRIDRLYTANRARTLFNYLKMAEDYVHVYETILGHV